MSKVLHIEIPKVPIFFKYGEGTISIAHIEPTDLRKIGKAWTDNLLRKADEIRKDKSSIENNKS